MCASTSWIFQASAATALLGLTSPICDAQVIAPQRAPQPFGGGLRMPMPSWSQLPPSGAIPIVRGPSILAMPSINGAAGYLQYATDSPGANRWSAPAPFDPGSANPIARGPATANPLLFTAGWGNAFAPNPPVVNRMPRNPFVLNQLLVNPLIGNRLADPLNGPILLAGGWGVPFIPARRENNPLAEARRPGSLLDQTPEFSPHSVAMTVYQPVSGIITLADGSTFYRGAGTSFANELGNSSAGGGLDSSRLGGNFFSPDLGTVGTLGQNAFLPYVW